MLLNQPLKSLQRHVYIPSLLKPVPASTEEVGNVDCIYLCILATFPPSERV